MIADFLPNILARFFCFGNYFTEVLPEAITQQLLKFSCTPTICVINQAYCILVTLKKGLDFFFFHTVSVFLFKEQNYNFFSSYPNYPTVCPPNYLIMKTENNVMAEVDCYIITSAISKQTHFSPRPKPHQPQRHAFTILQHLDAIIVPAVAHEPLFR